MTSTQAMGMANAAGWMDTATAQEVVSMMLGQLGIDIDLDELRQRLEKAAEEDDANAEYEIPAYFGMGKSAGPDSLRTALKPGQQPAQSGAADQMDMPGGTMDPTTITDIISKLSKSLVELGNARVIDGQFAQEVVAALFAKLGIEVDPAEMQARLEEEKAAAAEADAAAAAPADGTVPADGGLPTGDGVLNLDDAALAEVVALGGGDLHAGLTLLAEAFEQSLHPRGEGGRFAPKPKTEEPAQGGGAASGTANAQAAALAKKVAEPKQRAPRKPRDPNAPKTPRAPSKNPAMKSADLKSEIEDLKPGKAVVIQLTNGLEVSGTVEVAQGGVAMLKTSDGKYAILHSGLKGVSRIKTPSSSSSAAA